MDPRRPDRRRFLLSAAATVAAPLAASVPPAADTPPPATPPPPPPALPEPLQPPGPAVRVFFPSRTLVAVGYRSRYEHLDYAVYDLATGRQRFVLDPRGRNEPQQDGRYDTTVTLSPDGTRLLREAGGGVEVIDATSAKVLARCPATPAKSMFFWLSAGTVGLMDETGLDVWAVATGEVRSETLDLPAQGIVRRCRASADGRTVTYIRANQVGRVDVATGRATVLAHSPASTADPVAVSADGRRLAVRGKPMPRPAFGESSKGLDDHFPHWFVVFDRDTGRWPILPDREAVRFDLSACGRTLAVEGVSRVYGTGQPYDPAFELWEVATGGRRLKLPLTKPLDDLRCSPCGRFVGVVRSDTPLYLWDVYGEASDPKPEPTPVDLPRLWEALGAADAAEAFAAVRLLVQHPAAAVRLLRAKLIGRKPEPSWIAERVLRLSDPDYHARAAAERELAAVAGVIAGELKAAEADTEEAEARLERLVERATRTTRPADWLRLTRAVEVLEYAGGEAPALLREIAGGVEGAWITREARAAAERIGL